MSKGMPRKSAATSDATLHIRVRGLDVQLAVLPGGATNTGTWTAPATRTAAQNLAWLARDAVAFAMSSDAAMDKMLETIDGTDNQDEKEAKHG